MEACTRNDCRVRLLALGNGIPAADAFGILVACGAERKFGGIDAVRSAVSGFDLLDDTLGAERLLVVDTIVPAPAKPGTVHVLHGDQFPDVQSFFPHHTGSVPRQVTMIAVEAAGCTTVRGGIHPSVRAAVPKVIERIRRLLREDGNG